MTLMIGYNIRILSYFRLNINNKYYACGNQEVETILDMCFPHFFHAF